ncbi:hypothetical protein K8I61_01960 [bacterium]|nr:hypothetical protein [bacterium]
MSIRTFFFFSILLSLVAFPLACSCGGDDDDDDDDAADDDDEFPADDDDDSAGDDDDDDDSAGDDDGGDDDDDGGDDDTGDDDLGPRHALIAADGRGASVALSETGVAHAAWVTSAGALGHGTFDLESETWETAAIADDADAEGDTSVAVDGETAHVVYSQGGTDVVLPLIYLTQGETWDTAWTWSGLPGYRVRGHDLALDANGDAHIAFVVEYPDIKGVLVLMYATDASGAFVDDELDLVYPGGMPSIGIDASGDVYIVTGGRFYTNESGDWATTDDDNLTLPSLANEPDGDLYVGYLDSAGPHSCAWGGPMTPGGPIGEPKACVVDPPLLGFGMATGMYSYAYLDDLGRLYNTRVTTGFQWNRVITEAKAGWSFAEGLVVSDDAGQWDHIVYVHHDDNEGANELHHEWVFTGESNDD